MRLHITLREDEQLALARVARLERREAKAQAAILIREALEQRGLLATNTNSQTKVVQGLNHAN